MRVSTVNTVVVVPVNLLHLQEPLDSLDRDPGLHQTIDHPGEGIEGTDQHIEQRHTSKHLGFEKNRKKLENPGIDPGTSRMLSERSTI